MMEVSPAFIDETGVLTESATRQPLYGIGVLVVPRTKYVTESFYRLHFNFIQDMAKRRNELKRRINAEGRPLTMSEIDKLMWSSRHHEYKFAEVTHFNIQHYVDLLNLYFQFPELEFHSVMMNRLDPQASLRRWGNDSWLAYAHITKTLLANRLSRNVFAIVDLQSKPDSSSTHLEDILCSVDNVTGCLRATSDMSIFLQLVDLLLGCVQYDLKDDMGFYDPGSKRAMAKGQLAGLLKSKLGLGRGERILPLGETSNEWTVPSVFTVTGGDW